MSDIDSAPEKKHRTAISLDVKLYILKRFENGERAVDIAQAVGLPHSTVRTIRNNAKKIIASAKNGTPSSATKISRSRSSLMENMEKYLTMWIEEQQQNNMFLNIKIIQNKAKKIYEELKQEQGKNSEYTNETFDASRGWFDRFKRRSNLKTMNGEVGIEPEVQPVFENSLVPPSSPEDYEIETEDPKEELPDIKEEIPSPKEFASLNKEEILDEEVSHSPSIYQNSYQHFLSNNKRKLEVIENETVKNNEALSEIRQFATCENILTPEINNLPKEEDEFDILAKHIAIKIRKLTSEMRIHAEKLINDVLYHAQLEDLTRSSFVSV